jgi:hypothetical protein
VHLKTQLPIDCVLSGPGFEDQLFSRVVSQCIGTFVFPVIELHDLVVLKILASRPKDLEDVRAILRVQQSQLDCARIIDALVELESLLDQPDLVSVFESMLKRAQ